MKIAVVTDSNSGITQAQAKEMGVAVLPMPFMIDGETYYEDITLTQEQFYQRLKDNFDISTSQPTPDSIMKLWDELLKEYDVRRTFRILRDCNDAGGRGRVRGKCICR